MKAKTTGQASKKIAKKAKSWKALFQGWKWKIECLAAVICLSFYGVTAWVVRGTALPNLAEEVPVVDGWVVLDAVLLKEPALKEWFDSWQIFGQALTEWEGVENIQSIARVWNGKQEWTRLELSSRKEMEKQLDNAKVEGEMWVEDENGIQCFEWTWAMCFFWEGNVLWFADEAKELEPILKTAKGELAPMESDADYQKIRGRLVPAADGFIFAKTARIKHRFLHEAAALSSLVELFPAIGMNLHHDEEGKGLRVEQSTLVDRAKISQKAYDNPEHNVDQNLWKLSPDYPWTWEWTGTELSGQVNQMQELLSELSPAIGLDFESELNQQLGKWTQDLWTWEALSPYLEKSIYIGLANPGLNDALTSPKVLILLNLDHEKQQQFASHFNQLEGREWWNARAMNNGEIRRAAQRLSLMEQAYRGRTLFWADPAFAWTALDTSTFAVSTDIDILRQTVDRFVDQKPRYLSDQTRSFWTGSNELTILHCLDTQKQSILSLLCSGLETITMSRKRFDDGVFTRAFLRFQHD